MKHYIEAKSRLSNFASLTFRPEQKTGLTFLHNSPKRIRIVHAGMGSGKSLIGMVEGQQHSKFLYLCSSRQLQMQIEEEFPECEVMWGRGNFDCNAFPGLNASECPYAGDTTRTNTKRICKKSCDYEIQKKKVLDAPFQVLNYSYFLYEGNFVGQFSDYPLIICDEADKIESVVSKFINVRISKRLLGILRISPPRYITTKAANWHRSWQDWAGNTVEKVEAHRKRLKGRMGYLAVEDMKYKLLKDEAQYCKSLLWKLEVFIENMDDTWIFEEIKYRNKVTAWEFKPTWIPAKLMEKFFLRHGNRFVFMSATFHPVPILCQMLGINKSEVDYIEIPSTFPEENRRVMLERVGDLSFKTFDRDIPKIKNRIREILAAHPIEKGIIHTVSYRLTKEIMGLGDKRLMTHDAGNKDERLEIFKRSDRPLVFVSPSSCRGIDLPGDQCRFIIIPKMPFQSLADKLVSTRVYQGGIGSYWYNSDAIQEIIQGTGRGMRSKDDYCVTYVLDIQIVDRILGNEETGKKSMRELFPRYWLGACEI